MVELTLNQPDRGSQPQIPITAAPPMAAYVHIPFCRRRCYYCDFAVSIVGDRPPLSTAANPDGDDYGAIAQYLDLLCQEILTTPAHGPALTTVFFGGGTPSLLSARQIDRLLTTLDHHIGIDPTAEISVEMDPGTFDRPKLQGYCAAGINRVSLGVQSFDAQLLAACGRTHTPADIAAAVDCLHQVGLANISLDLISGLPHQTLAQWQASLQVAVSLAPPHLSVYDLTVEPGTAFGRWYQPGAGPLPSDEMTAQMYRLAQQLLTTSGYEHYEISNYARPGYQSRHNRVYWENQPYYGFGMGAASYVDGRRFTRPRTRRDYGQWVQRLSQAQGLIDCPVTPPAEAVLDTLMLGLRLADGLSLSQLAQQYGDATLETILAVLQPYQQRGWVQYLAEGQRANRDGANPDAVLPSRAGAGRIRLSDPDGFLFSNVVLSDLFERLG